MMRAKSIVCLWLLVLSLGMATSSVLGDDNKNQAAWDKLKQLSAGQQIQIVQSGAKSTTGSFRSVTDQAIVVDAGGGEQTIDRQSVLRVSSKGSGHRIRNALIGAGIGAGAGAGIGAGVGGCSAGGNCLGVSKGEVTGIGVAVGGAVGVVVGAVIPSGGWHEIYRAR